MRMAHKVALITGASSGIGKATAELFADNSYDLSLVGRDTARLQALADELSEKNVDVHVITADLSDPSVASNIVAETITTFHRLDVLVNAAGIIATGSVETTSYEDYMTMMKINVDSPFLLIKHAVPHLEKVKGSIVNVSSVAGKRSFPGIFSYSVSKAALDQMTRVAALDLASRGIRVNAVNPGVVVTELHKRGGMNEESYAKFLDHSKSTHPLGRVGTPQEIAELILFLASEKTAWITGETVSIDGGRFLTCLR